MSMAVESPLRFCREPCNAIEPRAMRQGAAEPLALALDLGTTGVRAALVDTAGALTREAYREGLPQCPAPGLVEHHGEMPFRATLAGLPAGVAEAPPSPG